MKDDTIEVNQDQILATGDSAQRTLANLRQSLVEHRPKFADFTTLRFVFGGYTYGALYAASKWYITGTGGVFGGNVFQNKRFLEIIAQAEKVEMATSWEEVF